MGDTGQQPIDAGRLRQALGRFATGIVVVTARVPGHGELIGMTMNSFNSVSLDPPLILFSIARSARSLDAWRRVSHYAVNVLERGQAQLSDRFARPMTRKWDGVAHHATRHGTPLLDGALACFECAAHDTVEGGDHLIFLGRVLQVTYRDDGLPLLYYRGAYAGLDPAPAWGRAAPAEWPLALHY